MQYSTEEGQYFELFPEMSRLHWSLEMPIAYYTIFWVTEGRVQLMVDNLPVVLNHGDLAFLTPNQYASIQDNQGDFIALQFNRSFYCTRDNDHEVSCNGLIFYGSKGMPVIMLEKDFHRRMEALYTVLMEEFSWRDSVQGEMLRTILKQWIILSTRLFKMQHITLSYDDPGIELIRSFNRLVEQHFREQHSVAFYATELNRSPKTLAHLFKKAQQPSPLQTIQSRIIVEAKRLLIGTDNSISEIAFDLGFEQVSSFSRMFKKQVGASPQSFRTLLYK